MERTERDALRCPLHAQGAASRALAATDLLALPLNRRAVVQYAVNDEGARELRLYYGDKEISFDEPELFAFGETLVRQSRFVAGSAATWGEGLDWARVKPLLEALIAEGVLHFGDEVAADPRLPGEAGVRASPLPPARASHPRTWFECEAITTELAGRALEVGHLEAVVPIFRIAHMALDADGRQVGEANVFPPALRLDVPTRWRACIYEGTRHQADKPMNVSALKAMRAHWGQMMAVLLAVRAGYLGRFPGAQAGWTVGHVERLAVAVLALPTWLLMRRDGRIANGELHPALSSVFRVTDGLRMVMHQMLFIPIGEAARPPGAPVTSGDILAYAERNYSFHAGHGVCAGPRAMVEEFLAVLVDGQMPREGLPARLDAQVAEALAEVDPALNYAFLGLGVYASVFTHWPLMARAYRDLLRLADGFVGDELRAMPLRDRLARGVAHLERTGFLADDDRCAHRERVFDDMFATCGAAIAGEPVAPTLSERLEVTPLALAGTAALDLRRALANALGLADDAEHGGVDAFVRRVMLYLRQSQALVRAAGEIGRDINALLGRARPERPLQVADIEIHNRLRGDDDGGRPPSLIDDLQELLGLAIAADRATLEIAPARSAETFGN